MNLTSTPYLVLFVILGSIAVTAAFAGIPGHIDMIGDVWVREDLMVDKNVKVLGELDVGGEIKQGGVPIDVTGTVHIFERDPTEADGGVGDIGDHWLNDGGDKLFLKTDETTWTSLGKSTSHLQDSNPTNEDGNVGDHWRHFFTGEVFFKFEDGWHSLGPIQILTDSDPDNDRGNNGDLWRNTSEDTFWIKIDNIWIKIGSDLFVEPTDPAEDEVAGEKGDHWLNTETGQIFWKAASGQTNIWLLLGGATGLQGPPGPPGTPGTTFIKLNDPTPADGGVGEIGDHWITESTVDVFIKVDETTWKPIGETGPQGPIGLPGEPGVPGPPGVSDLPEGCTNGQTLVWDSASDSWQCGIPVTALKIGEKFYPLIQFDTGQHATCDPTHGHVVLPKAVAAFDLSKISEPPVDCGFGIIGTQIFQETIHMTQSQIDAWNLETGLTIPQ